MNVGIWNYHCFTKTFLNVFLKCLLMNRYCIRCLVKEYAFIDNKKHTPKGPGGGLGITTDRDQQSRVFLNDPINTFQKSKPLKIPSQDTIHLAKVKVQMKCFFIAELKKQQKS